MRSIRMLIMSGSLLAIAGMSLITVSFRPSHEGSAGVDAWRRTKRTR